MPNNLKQSNSDALIGAKRFNDRREHISRQWEEVNDMRILRPAVSPVTASSSGRLSKSVPGNLK